VNAVESGFGDGPAAGNRLGISQDEEAVKASCTEFIRVYRRKDAWLIEAFREALKVTTAENLLQAAKRFAAENKGKEARYIVGAAKWLSSKGWRAFPAPVKPALHSIASEPPPRRDVGEHTICRTWRYKSKLFELEARTACIDPEAAFEQFDKKHVGQSHRISLPSPRKARSS
jgi:hypothetical protein